MKQLKLNKMGNNNIDTSAVRALGIELPDSDKVFLTTIEKLLPKSDDEIKHEIALKAYEIELKKLKSERK